jgi:hypothetical protein
VAELDKMAEAGSCPTVVTLSASLGQIILQLAGVFLSIKTPQTILKQLKKHLIHNGYSFSLPTKSVIYQKLRNLDPALCNFMFK